MHDEWRESHLKTIQRMRSYPMPVQLAYKRGKYRGSHEKGVKKGMSRGRKRRGYEAHKNRSR